MRIQTTGAALSLTIGIAATAAGTAGANEHCRATDPVVVAAIDGTVTLTKPNGTTQPLALGDSLCPGDQVRAGEDGRIELQFPARETTIGLQRNSTVRIPAVSEQGGAIALESGLLRFISSVRDFFTVETRHANAGIDGTEAIVATGPAAGTFVLVEEGVVSMAAAGAAGISLAAGESGYAAPGAAAARAEAATLPAAFRPLLLEPEGASDWAIHYPPILIAEGAADPELAAAAEALEAGAPDRAETILAGRDDARALALRSVVAVFRNRPGEGRDLAARAVATDPELGAAHVAESYALQAAGNLDAALEAGRRAAGVAPEDGFALARLAELQFLAGDAPAAGRTAEDALRARPTSLGEAVRGLAALQANRYDEAAAAFDAAAALDSEDPLGALGKGLLAIRRGDLEDGRRALELAASLDPRRASIRTLLGRAYAEEGFSEKALAQTDLAIARDPDDPAPWLTAAEVLYEENRPVEAMRSLEAAEDRAGNRAVLRTERGLAEDRAIHAASLGRVYDTLGFTPRAIQAGTEAAEEDPANAASHRLLADVLEDRRNADAARASSALRAFVYSQPNKAPIRPSQSESDLALIEGPAATRPSFAELTPFFDSDGFRADLSGFGGTQSTIGDEVSFTTLHQGFALGVGQFHYETEGYRFNNEVRHDVISIQGKAQIAPMIDVFAEYRYRMSDYGDRILEFDLADGIEDLDFQDERNLFRGGAHVRLGANQDLAFVGTYVRTSDTVEELDPFGFRTLAPGESESVDLQAQHVGRFGPVTTVVGGAYTEFDGDADLILDLGFIPPFSLGTISLEETRLSAYGYATWQAGSFGVVDELDLTAGLAIEHYDRESRQGSPFGPPLVTDSDGTTVNPKLGVRLGLFDRLTLRGAFTRAQQPLQATDERLEPVSVAGFTQFVDMPGGSDVWQGAFGLDLEITDRLTFGTEFARRRVEIDEFAFPGEPEIRETEVNAWLDATFGDQVAGRLAIDHLRTESTEGSGDLREFEVTEATAGLSWFHPSGFFAAGRAGVGWHAYTGVGGFQSDSDTFPVTELAIGYRLPDRRGIVSLELQNVTDSDFGFEDRPVETGTAPLAEPRFARDFTALARVRLNF